jgi:periplasmic divalent cation tolerance protein
MDLIADVFTVLNSLAALEHNSNIGPAGLTKRILYMTDKIVVFSTCGSQEEAELLARRLVEARLAACVNVIMQIRSFYRWQGKIEESGEWLLVIKTSRDVFDEVRAVLEAAHSYELPEVLALPVVAGSPNYLAWLEREIKSPDNIERD